MAHRILSHPFRLAGDGSAATVEQGTPAGQAEQLAVHLLTRIGERELVPTFGVTDPTFAEASADQLAASVDAFGPDVTIAGLDVDYPSDTQAAVVVTFTD